MKRSSRILKILAFALLLSYKKFFPSIGICFAFAFHLRLLCFAFAYPLLCLSLPFPVLYFCLLCLCPSFAGLFRSFPKPKKPKLKAKNLKGGEADKGAKARERAGAETTRGGARQSQEKRKEGVHEAINAGRFLLLHGRSDRQIHNSPLT